MGRDARFGPHNCVTASEAERDEFRCPDYGRAPAAVPTYRVDMGPTSRAILTTQCPVGLSTRDKEVALWLTAYGMVKRWQKWPPGRDDPRLLEALTVIQREHDLIDLERTPK